MKPLLSVMVLTALVAPAVSGQTVAFENVHVVPMDRERVLETQTVVVRDARSSTWNVPTMYLWDLFHNAETGEALRGRLTETRYLPRTMIDEWVKSKNNRLRPPNDTPTGVGGFGQTGLRVIELRRKILAALKAANAPIALGTDSPQMFSVPGFSMHRELQLMVELGFTPFEALETGTLKVAEYFGTVDETGTVERGKRADLILLNGNPLRDIANTERAAGVMVNGRWFPDSAIQERLSAIATRAATR